MTTRYRGRLAPSPTGYLHLGHARTFWIAHERAQAAGGQLILRNDDLDRARCREEFVVAMFEDLQWIGLQWEEGPDCGGPFAPYAQSERQHQYIAAFEVLRAAGWIYPCTCSRQEVLRALTAPHPGQEEPLYPGTCRMACDRSPRAGANWRFRIARRRDLYPSRMARRREMAQVAGVDFGDFLVWRKDGCPAISWPAWWTTPR